MFIDKPLRVALALSALFHMAIFLPLPYLRAPLISEPPLPIINYLMPEQVIPQQPQAQDKPVTKMAAAELEKTVQANKQDTEIKLEAKAPSLPKKPIVKEAAKAEQALKRPEEIEIPADLPKEKEALYLDYYQSIREKIRRYVVQNYSRFVSCGEVCLYFVLSSDGHLRQIDVVEERSAPHRQLKEISKKSVEQASPFSAFPKDLAQNNLSFNVIISFEVEP